jgi:hypothetical protein
MAGTRAILRSLLSEIEVLEKVIEVLHQAAASRKKSWRLGKTFPAKPKTSVFDPTLQLNNYSKMRPLTGM